MACILSTIQLETTGTSGVLTSEQLSKLQESKTNYIVYGTELYKLVDNNENNLIYICTTNDNGVIKIKSIIVTISTLAWVYSELVQESSGTIVNVNNIAQTSIDFDSDPQTQIDTKVDKNVSDLVNYTLSTGVGSKLSLSVNTTNYLMTVSLLNSEDTVLSTQTVDLPLESMVVGASYADGILTLSLQNGQTLNVNISDIVDGLVPESRTINGKPLSSNIILTNTDVGAPSVSDLTEGLADKVDNSDKTNYTTVGSLAGKSTWSNDTNVPTMNTIAYWDGRYQTTNNQSNLRYARTPASTSDNNEISTTEWTNDKISTVNTSISNIINNTTKIANLTYGAAFGTNSSTTYGGAVGLGATSTTGGAMGNGSETTNGGAIGNASSSENGGAVGYGAVTTTGGAVGGNAKAINGGGAIGYVSNTTSGGAVGSGAYSTTGGAIGNGATATVGFSGGQNAKSSVDSVQLGTGTNLTAKTLQVYNDNIYNANTHTLTVQNIDNVWTCFYDDTLTTSDVNAVSINNIFDFDNYDYKIEMATIMTNSSGNTWNSETIMGYYINSSGNDVTIGNINWSRHYSNENYTTSGGTQQGSFTPHGYGGSWDNNDVAFQDWDTNDGDGDVLFQAEITPVNYGRLIQLWRWVRNSIWQQTDYKYSGLLIPSTTDGTITGIKFRINSGTGYFKANAGHIKIYRRPGGWNNYLGG